MTRTVILSMRRLVLKDNVSEDNALWRSDMTNLLNDGDDSALVVADAGEQQLDILPSTALVLQALPMVGDPPPAMQKWFETTDPVFKKFATFVVAAPGAGAPCTDYDVIGK